MDKTTIWHLAKTATQVEFYQTAVCIYIYAHIHAVAGKIPPGWPLYPSAELTNYMYYWKG